MAKWQHDGGLVLVEAMVPLFFRGEERTKALQAAVWSGRRQRMGFVLAFRYQVAVQQLYVPGNCRPQGARPPQQGETTVVGNDVGMGRW